MDIEGAELMALQGAEKIIRKYKPKLAVCVYHKPEDIIEILKYTLELNPEYVYIRIPEEYLCVYHIIMHLMSEFGEVHTSDKVIPKNNIFLKRVFNLGNVAL